VNAVLLDIEGTTTPIAFVFEVLFPYARTHLHDHLERHHMTADYQSLVDDLHGEHDRDMEHGEAVPAWNETSPDARVSSLVRYCEWLMDRDRKSTPLKAIQGKIWEDGYRRGELVGEMFADVPAALKRWTRQRIGVGIFSSGSVLAQQLIFRHSSAGDLTPYLRWYFDTTTGAKSESDSYRRIARAMDTSASDVMFMSDVIRELDAARDAGMATRLAVRPGNPPVADARGHQVIHDFDALAFVEHPE
jgi:enolase-phosphatase E1